MDDALGLLLPDQRFDDELRPTREQTEREDHLGQARCEHPKFIIESDATIVAPLVFARAELRGTDGAAPVRCAVARTTAGSPGQA